jgi:hypothetical protein
MDNGKIRPIAFYLPQYYPTPENDLWWEPGFTEWTNVKRAVPLFKGHCQPRIPAGLGYYDLRDPEIRERQAQMAAEAGIEGFCYWHYWFDGQELLGRVLDEVVASGKPDFPFCMCWANHSWYRKTWEPGKDDRLLIEQTYPGVEDYVRHFNALLPAFKDKRYIKADGRLLFGIFDSDRIPDFPLMRQTWDALAKENGLPGFCFFGFVQGAHRLEGALKNGYDTIVYEHMTTVYKECRTPWKDFLCRTLHCPVTLRYSKYAGETLDFLREHPELTPCLIPDFDHSPRSGYRWIIMKDSTPQKWYDLCRQCGKMLLGKDGSEKLLFLKAWNEWGEGNYLEPERRFGNGYLDSLAQALRDAGNQAL